MLYYALKVGITALVVVAVSELAKRSSLLGAILASIPLVSVLGMLWLYIDTHDVGRIAALSSSIVWLVLPSLVLFILLPILLRLGMNFYLSLGLAISATVLAYWLMVAGLRYFDIHV